MLKHGALLTACFMALATTVHAQNVDTFNNYPNKTIRIVFPYPPGVPPDIMARKIANRLWKQWGQPVIVDNQIGAAGNIGGATVAKSSPDGYTLLFAAPGPLVTNKLLYPELSYDPDKFVPISLVATWPNVLVIHPKVGATDVQKLVALARSNPSKLNYSSGGNGSTQHLAAELLNTVAGIKITHVPYKGAAPAFNGLLAGEVDVGFVNVDFGISALKTQKLRVLASGSDKPNPQLPDVPTLTQFFPGVISVSWVGMVAPPSTPNALATKLSIAIAQATKDPEFSASLIASGIEPVGSTPGEMAKFMAQERERWSKVVRDASIKAEQ